MNRRGVARHRSTRHVDREPSDLERRVPARNRRIRARRSCARTRARARPVRTASSRSHRRPHRAAPSSRPPSGARRARGSARSSTLRSRRQTSMPSMSGRPRSSTMRSGRSAAAMRSPSSPDLLRANPSRRHAARPARRAECRLVVDHENALRSRLEQPCVRWVVGHGRKLRAPSALDSDESVALRPGTSRTFVSFLWRPAVGCLVLERERQSPPLRRDTRRTHRDHLPPTQPAASHRPTTGQRPIATTRRRIPLVAGSRSSRSPRSASSTATSARARCTRCARRFSPDYGLAPTPRTSTASCRSSSGR